MRVETRSPDDRGPNAAKKQKMPPRPAYESTKGTQSCTAPNCFGSVRYDSNLDGRRDRSLQHREQRLDPLDRVDDVSAGLTLNREDDRGLLVEPRGRPVVLGAVNRLSDVLDPDWRTIAICDDKVVVGGWVESVVG